MDERPARWAEDQRYLYGGKFIRRLPDSQHCLLSAAASEENRSDQPGCHLRADPRLALALCSCQYIWSPAWLTEYSYQAVSMDLAGPARGGMYCAASPDHCHHRPAAPLVSHCIQ